MKGVSLKAICLLVFLGSCLSCKKPSGTQPPFSANPETHPLDPLLHEVSGIADSKLNPGRIWAHEDGGNPSRLYLVARDGIIQKSIHLEGLANRDWEEMTLSGTDLYLAETGDNFGLYSEYYFYRFPEPPATADTVRSFETIRFMYPDGPHDSEAFLVDPGTRDIYIITKPDQPSRVYRLSFPYRTDTVNRVQWIGNLAMGGVVSAGISPDGKEALIKTYGKLYYFTRKDNETLMQLLQKEPVSLAYDPEPQGEALCFANDASGFFTLSETGFSSATQLRFYRRN